MTPTLWGRITTRILLFILIGLPVTFFYAWWQTSWNWPPSIVPFIILATLLIVGLVLDPIYIFLQGFRWDHDWPFAFQFLFSIIEFLIVLLIIDTDWHPLLLPAAIGTWTDLGYVTLHFTLVFIPSFLALLGGLQIFLVRWRFKAGQLGKM